MPQKLNDRERATILAALRYWQHEAMSHPEEVPSQIDMIASDMERLEPLSRGEIDDLCLYLNLQED